jgi:3-oxoacyl-[acyl-carrier-protein] synthase-3
VNSIKIASVGSCVPDRVVTNDDLSRIVDTGDEWIFSRTGIHERRFAEEGIQNVDLAARAACQALDRAGAGTDDVDVLIVATFTPDSFTPGVASCVHGRLGLDSHVLSFDLNGACCGFLYALRVAQGQLALDPAATILVIGSELVSGILDFSDRSTCVLFGDGAAAAVVRASDEPCWFTAGTCGNSEAIVSSARYAPHAVPGIQMRGQEVFRFACTSIERSIGNLLDQAGLALDDIDFVVCHQANARIISHVVKHLDADPAQFFMNVEHLGNTSAASIPLALADMLDRGVLQRGCKIIMVGFGAGLSEGGVLLTW